MMSGSKGEKRLMKWGKWLKKGDIAVAGLILLLAGASLLPFVLQNSQKTYCIITRDDAIIEQVELTEQTSQTIEIQGSYSNTVRIEGGEVWVSHSTCPNQLCVHSGSISRSGQAIVCLPNQVLIRIASSEEQEVDIVAQ